MSNTDLGALIALWRREACTLRTLAVGQGEAARIRRARADQLESNARQLDMMTPAGWRAAHAGGTAPVL